MSLPADNLRHTLNQYRIPLVITTVGVTLAIVGFILALNWQMENLKSNFTRLSAQEAALIDNRFLLFQEKIRGVLSLFDVLPKVDAAALKTFSEPMLYRIGIEMLGWIPKAEYGGPSFFIEARTSTFSMDLSSLTAISQVAAALKQAQAMHSTVISHPFVRSERGAQDIYTALIVPFMRKDNMEGTLIGVVNLDQIYNSNPEMSLQPEKATIYLFDGPAGDIPFYMIGRESLPLSNTPREWRNTIQRSSFNYSELLYSTHGQQSLTFVPTPAYLLQGLGLLPWVVLFGALALTAMVSMLVFQQTRQGLVIANQVDEKTMLLFETARTLAEKENKLRAIVDHTIDGLITINAAGIIESFNPACEHIFGYKGPEVIGQNIKILMPEPYHGQHDGYISHYLATGEAKIIGTAGRELMAKRKDGSLFPIDLSISSFRVEDEPYFSGIIRDITARKKIEEEREHYMKDLEISNRELDDFAYITSHDLKEPLRGLQNFSKFLMEDYADKLDEDGKSKLVTIIDLTKRLEDCLNALLHYSRLGRTAMAVQETDMNDLVQNVVSIFSISLKEKNATVAIARKLPTIVCDHVRITEVFQNLVGNAIKYNSNPENKIEIGYIDNHPRRPGEKVFFVKDNGIGVKQEHLEAIFKIFKRLHPRNAYGGGTGSGLTIAKKIINQHGGDMWAESEGEGKGTTFLFTIPPPPPKA